MHKPLTQEEIMDIVKPGNHFKDSGGTFYTIRSVRPDLVLFSTRGKAEITSGSHDWVYNRFANGIFKPLTQRELDGLRHRSSKQKSSKKRAEGNH